RGGGTSENRAFNAQFASRRHRMDERSTLEEGLAHASSESAEVVAAISSLHRVASLALALMPVVSFAAQYYFSLRAGTQQIMLHHLTIMVVDWVFVPFNYLVVRVIDWQRGGRIFAAACFAVVMNALTHAVWQQNGVDPGHMITRAGIVLPAGWVHLVFSTL